MAERKYWKSIEERNFDEQAFTAGHSREFQEELPTANDFADLNLDGTNATRRDFLKVLGFSVTAAAVAASCEMPVRKSIPYLIKPDEITPGVANFYASSFYDGSEYGSVLVKTREARPIKIEGNPKSKVTNGGTSAVAQASVLNLYDKYRSRFPKVGGEKSTWEKLDGEVISKLQKIKAEGGAIRILSSSIISPSSKAAIQQFIAAYPGTQHVTYDAVSYDGMLNANEKSFGRRVIPSYYFDKAAVIVSLGADFLGTWLCPVEHCERYARTRKVTQERPEMSRHIQIESYMSMTGGNADTRIVVKPSQEAAAVLYLHSKIVGGESVSLGGIDKELDAVAAELLAAKGKSLVVSGSNDENVQLLVNAINNALGNIGTTIDYAAYYNLKQGNDVQLKALVDDMSAGKIAGLLIYEANPAYNYFEAEKVKDAIAKTDLTVCLNERVDETSILCDYHAPNHHYLEAWNDLEPKNGSYSITQPTIEPLHDTRHASESLLRFAGISTEYYDFIRNNWQSVFASQSAITGFGSFWDYAVQNGVYDKSPEAINVTFAGDVNAAVAAIKGSQSQGGVEVKVYEKVGIRDGRYAGNPWLQELPDPVSKATWDNYAAISYQLAEKLGCSNALFRSEKGFGVLEGRGNGTDTDVIKVVVNNVEFNLPVIIQPGTPQDTIAIALGYGHTQAGKTGTNIGRNVYSLTGLAGNTRTTFATGAKVSRVDGKVYPIAQTQHHHTIDDGLQKRPLVKETTLAEYKKNPHAGNEDREEVLHHLKTLYGYHTYAGHKWAMSIDLNSCFGCGACVIACTAENNVPVVGKDEVRRSREMHWLRIDRYYSGTPDNPSIVFQPMLCQHCENAPCENVCPVSATNHSSDGINQMAYNRCIGTRYCANNCPYKVRRFNWFDYQNADSFKKGTFFDNEHDAAEMNDDLTRMVLNPDVTVRSRGVMEKCTFCVQRIQEGKLKAKKESRKLRDGEVVTACAAACTAGAIVFGNVNDANSEVAKLESNPRTFKVIEEIHTLPAIGYLTKVRNRKEEAKA
ncbi:MAG: TAT-variant-translocated molybdopterin oxidoreductase [Chitinophagales bacterium]|nr:TAT-variant-translocated molybdopterin oxidoreductase [Chitinophagales bacterium]